MPFYQYVCDSCGHRLEEFCSVSKFKKKLKCPECKTNNLVYQYGNVAAQVIGNPRTLGSLAEQNSRKIGSDGVKKREAEDESVRKPKKNKESSPELKAQIKKLKKIGSMSQSQKDRYIHTGEGL